MAPYVFSTALKALLLTCDIIHIQKPSPLTCPGYLAKIKNKTFLVQDVDDLDHAVMIAEKHLRIRIWTAEKFERFFPKLADHIVTCSSYLKRIYENAGVEKDKITWISNGVNASEFDLKPNLSLKEDYRLKDRVIVYVGSLNIETQVSLLLRSMKSIAKERDVSCVIIGDGKARPRLESLTRKLGLNQHVVFVGHVQHVDVPKFLSISDIGYACFPRIDYIEAASNIKVFEYMASGIPPVVSPVGDLPYYVDFGNAGVITEYNVEDVSKALLCLLDDEKKRRKFGEYARRYVKDNFDWQVLTKRLLGIYEKLQEQK
jgi:glycosyltransferase involved in cell wall biosynthesis